MKEITQATEHGTAMNTGFLPHLQEKHHAVVNRQ